ncbi:MAG: DUF1489 family protein [Parasphingopyxis sp.]|nr:DUF1489 domain-containing protein [Sphingomonadales bacterium]
MTAALHMTKVAAGCRTVDALRRRQAGRAENGKVAIVTRYRPTRHEELIGGSLYWIIKHRLVVRQRILGFGEADDGRCRIDLDARIVPVRTQTKRAHQGWRYLTGEDAPADFGSGAEVLAEMPPRMLNELARLALI